MDPRKYPGQSSNTTEAADVPSILLSLKNSQSERNTAQCPPAPRRQLNLSDLINPTDVEPKRQQQPSLSCRESLSSQPVLPAHSSPPINVISQPTSMPSVSNNRPCKVGVHHSYYENNLLPFVPPLPMPVLTTTPTSPRTPEAVNKRDRTETTTEQLGIPDRPLKIYGKSTMETTNLCSGPKIYQQALQAQPEKLTTKTPKARTPRKYPRFDFQVSSGQTVQPDELGTDQPNSAKRKEDESAVKTLAELLSRPLDDRRGKSPRIMQTAEASAPPALNITRDPKARNVKNVGQNGYYSSSQSLSPVATAHNAVQTVGAKPPHLARASGEGHIIAQQTDESSASPQNDDRLKPKVYDLAKIREIGFAVIGGRAYNPQNHPVCAATRMDGEGKPCKRNVSGSNACRWHGPVEFLTPMNTVNGKLDKFANFPPVGARSGNARSAGLPAGGPSAFSARAQVTPPSQAVVRPRVVHRTLRWNNEEHFWFLLGIQVYSHRWSKIAKVVGTRDTLQVQSHAQKYLERMKKVDKKKRTIHDLPIDGPEMSHIRAKYTEEEIAARVKLGEGDERPGCIVKLELGGAGPSGH